MRACDVCVPCPTVGQRVGDVDGGGRGGRGHQLRYNLIVIKLLTIRAKSILDLIEDNHLNGVLVWCEVCDDRVTAPVGQTLQLIKKVF